MSVIRDLQYLTFSELIKHLRKSPEVKRELAEVGAHFIYAGAREFQVWSECMCRETGVYQGPVLKEIYAESENIVARLAESKSVDVVGTEEEKPVRAAEKHSGAGTAICQDAAKTQVGRNNNASSKEFAKMIESRRNNVIWVGVVIFVLMGIFPPFLEKHDFRYLPQERSAGYAPIVLPPTPSKGFEVVRVDWSRLLLQWIVLLVATGAFARTRSRSKRNCGSEGPQSDYSSTESVPFPGLNLSDEQRKQLHQAAERIRAEKLKAQSAGKPFQTQVPFPRLDDEQWKRMCEIVRKVTAYNSGSRSEVTPEPKATPATGGGGTAKPEATLKKEPPRRLTPEEQKVLEQQLREALKKGTLQ